MEGMTRGYLVLDIETVPDRALYGAPEAAEAGVERRFPPLYAHRPVVLGVLWLILLWMYRRRVFLKI